MRSVYHDFSTKELGEIFHNEHQTTVAKAIMTLSPAFSLSDVIGHSPLLAQSLVGPALSAPLAANQWVLEVENWLTVSLVQLQRLMLEYITGPSSSQYLQFIPQHQAENSTALRWMCGNQIIKRSDYTNFHVLSIILLFAFGLVLYIVNQSLETVVGWSRSRWRTGRWRQRAWWAEGTLQLQRRVFEGMGIRNWELDEWDRVPVTEEGRMFSAMRNWDEMLPVASERGSVGWTATSDAQSPTSKTPGMGSTIVQVDSKSKLNNEQTRECGSESRCSI